MVNNTKEFSKNAIKKSKYFKKLEDKAVQCILCPRECKIERNKIGYCEVRKNIDGQLFNLNYGISTYMVVEPIETNAIFHFYPGEDALAVGSIGCNLDCSFCQAWQYSKIKNIEEMNLEYFDHYTPEQIVNKAKKLDLSVISWTFNDPMSWFEFVLDTAKLAKEYGIVSLFKSNHYINEAPLKDLAQYVDVFSISIKSMEDEFYRKYCQGSLEPVLNAAKTLKRYNKHIEICNLVIPTLNDSKKHFNKLINWVKENLGMDTPLHFARFHPDYKLTNLSRTSLSDINRAIEIARDNGFKYIYSGNTYMDEGLNGYCSKCGNLLIDRKGGRTIVINEDLELCDKCKTPHQIRFLKSAKNSDYIIKNAYDHVIEYTWKEKIWSIHVQVINYSNEKQVLLIHNDFRDNQGNLPFMEKINVAPHEKLRYTFNRINEKQNKIVIYYDKTLDLQIFENLDRAYYSLEKYKEPIKKVLIMGSPQN